MADNELTEKNIEALERAEICIGQARAMFDSSDLFSWSVIEQCVRSLTLMADVMGIEFDASLTLNLQKKLNIKMAERDQRDLKSLNPFDPIARAQWQKMPTTVDRSFVNQTYILMNFTEKVLKKIRKMHTPPFRETRSFKIGLGVTILAVLGFAIVWIVRTNDEAKNEWQAQYFQASDLSGEAVVTSHLKIDFSWNGENPIDGISGNDFSAAFTTCIEAVKGERLRWKFGADDGIRVYLDSNLILDKWIRQGMTFFDGNTYLEPGIHRVRIEYNQLGGSAGLLAELEQPLLNKFRFFKPKKEGFKTTCE